MDSTESQQQNEMRFAHYMPCIYWHDKEPILCIDVLQEPSNGKDFEIPVYKLATASMQKEIRLWNFRFIPIPVSKPKTKELAKEELVKSTNVQELELLKLDAAQKSKEEELEVGEGQQQQEEDSIICLESEKENKAGDQQQDVEMMDVVEVHPCTSSGGIIARQKDPQAAQQPPQSFSFDCDFLANLEGHRITTNVIRFSPNGAYLASGDSDGCIIVWAQQKNENSSSTGKENGAGGGASMAQMQQKWDIAAAKKQGDPEMDIPPNKENWTRAFRIPIRHDADVTGLCFSPDSQFIASVSMDDFVAIHRTDTGKRVHRYSFRHFPNGIAWDPRGKYIITLSTDRKLDVLDAQKLTKLRCCHQVELPSTPLHGGIKIVQQQYKVFHDDQLFAFQRGVEFSPCGGIVFAPAVHVEVGSNNIYGTFAFKRADLNLCRPSALFPTLRPTVQVKCSPLIYQLQEGPNFLGLPHRLIFAVLCRDSVLLYNSQTETPFAYIDNLHYDQLTCIAWTPDARVLVISSLEGFNSFIRVDTRKMGIPCERQPDFVAFQQQPLESAIPSQGSQQKTPIKSDPRDQPQLCPLPAETVPTTQNQPGNLPPPFVSLLDSPKLITPRRVRTKKTATASNTGGNTPQVAGGDGTPKQIASAKGGKTPKSNGQGILSADQTPKTIVPRKKPKKLEVISLDQGDAKK